MLFGFFYLLLFTGGVVRIFFKNISFMILFYSELFNLGLYFLLSIVLCGAILFFSYRFSSYIPDTEKVSAYECGFDPYEDSRNNFDVRFYLVAILFILFDLEAVFFYPWCIILSFLNDSAFWGMFDFILELGIGFIYAWEIGALEWR